MEIQKIFSDEYDKERLYSVLLDEEEMYLFSELQKEFAVDFGRARELAMGTSKAIGKGFNKVDKGLKKSIEKVFEKNPSLKEKAEIANEKVNRFLADTDKKTVGQLKEELRTSGRQAAGKAKSYISNLLNK